MLPEWLISMEYLDLWHKSQDWSALRCIRMKRSFHHLLTRSLYSLCGGLSTKCIEHQHCLHWRTDTDGPHSIATSIAAIAYSLPILNALHLLPG